VNIAVLVWSLAAAAPQQDCVSALKTDIAACDATIASQSDRRAKAELLFHRAYALVEKYSYDEALRDLDEAIRLAPDFANAYRERSYVLAELREFERAVQDLNRAVALSPDRPGAYQERAFARHGNGDLEGAYSDRARVVELAPDDADAILARSVAALWLGRFEEASRDAEKALRLAAAAKDEKVIANVRKQQKAILLWQSRIPGGSPERRCRDAMKTAKMDRSSLIGDCTAAFLAAKTGAEKAGLLTVRSLAWLVAEQNEPASIADQVVAVGIDPGNADWRANLGSSYVRVRHSQAGLRELNRSLAIKESWIAYAGRASARYNLADRAGAFADAKKSFEMHPNEVALIVLGDLSHDKGDLASARRYWITAYRMGSRDDRLIERLKSIGVEHPERGPKDD
jgi:tetratricopeptide (TPR) repeat protein